MKIIFALLFAISTAVNALPYRYSLDPNAAPGSDVIGQVSSSLTYLNPKFTRLFAIKKLLQKQEPNLKPEVINKVLSSLACAQSFRIDYNPILTIIDYSKPSNQKRLWVFDLITMKLLYYTYVSHGIASGALNTVSFSNRYNSKASSMGVYLTGESYYGREGLSMHLQGLERGFNSNAMRRYLVMHGGWYVAENFIKKYGRPGRSWGCPALPYDEVKQVIDAIKDDTFLVIYYPSDDWLAQSKFLHCNMPPGLTVPETQKIVSQLQVIHLPYRAPILFSDLNGDDRREQNEPIIVMKANDYIKFYHTKAPLKRMLRRQINHQEYIALSPNELNHYLDEKSPKNPNFSDIYLIVPEVIKQRGVWRTLMKVVHHGKIVKIKHLPDSSTDRYLIQFDKKSNLTFKPTHRFIRWLGL